MAGMQVWAVERVQPRFVPSGILRTVEDRRLAIRTVFWAALVEITAVAAFLPLWFGFGEIELGILVVTTLVVSTLALAVFVLSGRSVWVVRIDMWSLLALTIAGHALLGGYVWSGGYLLFGIVTLFVAALLLENREVVLVTGVWSLAAVALVPLEETLRAARDQPPALTVSVAVLVGIFFTSVLEIVPVVLLLSRRLRGEHDRSRRLMLNILPETVADRLKDSPGMIADRFDGCSIVFADLVGFTAHSKGKDPEHLVGELNTIFTRFDALAADHGGEKIKTIGDGYMAATGLPDPDSDHIRHACDLALAMVDAMPALNAQLGTDFQLRVGVNTGSAVAGVVGTSKFSYDVWGETVNLASRLESNGAPGIVAVSASVAGALDGHRRVEALGVKELKGQGPTEVYRLLPLSPSQPDHQTA